MDRACDEAIRTADSWMLEGAPRALSSIDGSSPDAVLRQIKALTEILFWYRYVSPDLHSESSLKVLHLLSDTIDWSLLLSIFRHNPELSSLFLALASVTAGSAPASVQTDILKLANLFQRLPRERTTFRRLDAIHGYFALGLKAWSAEQIEQLMDGGCLPKEGDIPHIIESDFYAITHTIFYLTDFGRRPLSRTHKTEELQFSWIFALGEHVKSIKDYDIFSEFALCLDFLCDRPSIPTEWAEFLCKSQEHYGYWKPIEAVKNSVSQSGLPTKSWEFFSNYHTTLLARDALARFSMGQADVAKFALPSLPNIDWEQVFYKVDSVALSAVSRFSEFLVSNDENISSALCSSSQILLALEALAPHYELLRLDGLINTQLTALACEDPAMFSARRFRIWAAANRIFPSRHLAAERVGYLSVNDANGLDWVTGKCWLASIDPVRFRITENLKAQMRTELLIAIGQQDVIRFVQVLPHVDLSRSDFEISELFYNSMRSNTLGFGFPNPLSPHFKDEVALWGLLDVSTGLTLMKKSKELVAHYPA